MYSSEQHRFSFKGLSLTGGFCSSKIPGTVSKHKGSAGLSGFLETRPGGHRYQGTTDSMDHFLFCCRSKTCFMQYYYTDMKSCYFEPFGEIFFANLLIAWLRIIFSIFRVVRKSHQKSCLVKNKFTIIWWLVSCLFFLELLLCVSFLKVKKFSLELSVSTV